MSAARFSCRGLYPILDRDACRRRGWDPSAVLSAWLAEGALWVQLRAKNATTRLGWEWATPLVAQAQAAGALVILNDRADWALMTGADGVHLGQDDLTVSDARRVLGEEALIGVSTHDLAELARAERDGADYVGFGPVFPSDSKSDAAPARGLERLRRACAAARLPVVAIGGIDADRLPLVMDCGAAGAAAIAALLDQPLAETYRKLAQAARRL